MEDPRVSKVKQELGRPYVDTVDAKPRDFDFGVGFADTWDVRQPNLRKLDEKEIKKLLDDMGVGYEKDDNRDKLEEYVTENYSESFAPMMNYIYPLIEDHIPDDFATKLANTTIVDIKENGEYTPYLALTGGGMDFSWEIVESYANLDQAAPIHFCNLPDMAGTSINSPGKRKAMNACLRSVSVMKIWMEGREESLKNSCAKMGGEIVYDKADRGQYFCVQKKK